MALPIPQNPRVEHDSPAAGITFDLELDGRRWRCLITNEAIDALYGPHRHDADRVRRVQQHSYITRLVAQEIRDGNTHEPIVLTWAMVTSGKYASWRVTFVYEGGPLDGDREERPPSTMDPSTMEVIWSDTGGADGQRRAYTIAARAVDPTSRTAVITMKWGVL